MGLPMDDIHTPTVASGPTPGRSPANDDLDKLPLMDLVNKKVKVEEELSALGGVLDSVSCRLRNAPQSSSRLMLVQHGVNMNTTLTTFDGYPRDDIDIAQSV